MDAELKTDGKVHAWQPFTPQGVAAFAGDGLSRLLLVELIMALLAGFAIAWFIRQAWFPPIEQAIRQLPDRGDIYQGRLEWTNTPARPLAFNNYLSIVVDPKLTGRTGQIADLQIEFGQTRVRLSGLLGVMTFDYPKNGAVAFNRRELVPWWGAWSQAILTGAVAGVALSLLLGWALLAGLYAPVAKVIAFLCHRALGWAGAWRLASAALMPGAVLMTGAIVLYGLNFIDLFRLGFITLFHFIVGWVFLVMSTLCLPKASTEAKSNPFASDRPTAKSKGEGDNPFS